LVDSFEYMMMHELANRKHLKSCTDEYI